MERSDGSGANSPVERSECPLCGRANQCQLCTISPYKGSCWCERMRIPEELLARVPTAWRGEACVCLECVQAYHRERVARQPEVAGPGDFTLEPGGLVVFTAAYLLHRGYCCGSGCRNCPYPPGAGR